MGGRDTARMLKCKHLGSKKRGVYKGSHRGKKENRRKTISQHQLMKSYIQDVYFSGRRRIVLFILITFQNLK